ncbi:MAG: hypothetical protein LKCHEGNO_00438 [Burkholderiaceae bacterium]|nr:hypothetical protein [Burkholderiaceae bacterium]
MIDMQPSSRTTERIVATFAPRLLAIAAIAGVVALDAVLQWATGADATPLHPAAGTLLTPGSDAEAHHATPGQTERSGAPDLATALPAGAGARVATRKRHPATPNQRPATASALNK